MRVVGRRLTVSCPPGWLGWLGWLGRLVDRPMGVWMVGGMPAWVRGMRPPVW